MRNVRRDRPGLPGPKLAALLADSKDEGAAQADAQLLVLVPVLGNHALGIELDHAEGDPLAVHDAPVDAVPDALEIERREAGESAHGDEPTSPRRKLRG